jgi:hypothetical protein
MKTKFLIEKLSPLELPQTESLAFEEFIIEADSEFTGFGHGLLPRKLLLCVTINCLSRGKMSQICLPDKKI